MEKSPAGQQGQYKFAEAQKPLELEETDSELLHCPHCKYLIKGDDINVHKLIAKCSHCGQVFSFEHAFPRKLEGYSRPDMLIPSGLEVLKLENELDIQANWLRTIPRSALTFTLIFTLVWNLILLPFVIAAIAMQAYGILLFTSVHLLVGIAFLMRTLALFVNTTHVNVTRRQLEIRTGPVPALFRHNRAIPASEVDQLYVTKYVDSRTNGVPNYAYSLFVILKGGKKLQLLKGMNAETQKYLEYEIESFLGIKDRKVAEAV